MRQSDAIKLAQYHAFTKVELYNMLKEGLDTFPDSYWKKASPSNPIFDNGHYFNWCVKLIDYKEGINDDKKEMEIIVVRVLERFGQFAKSQIPKKPAVEIQYSETPTLER